MKNEYVGIGTVKQRWEENAGGVGCGRGVGRRWPTHTGRLEATNNSESGK
jgi:hypothetical protein